MKKLLPIILIVLFFIFVPTTFGASHTDPGGTILDEAAVANNTWQQDSEVTFAGKMAVRAGDFLTEVLENYQWSTNSPGDFYKNLGEFWVKIRDIVYLFLLIVILISAFVIIVTRGKNLAIMQFIPRFVIAILLVTFSFSIIETLYNIVDMIQGFFLQNPAGEIISKKDLLSVGFTYPNFLGYRIVGPDFDESVFVSLLLVKLTSITYFVMSGLLLIRKIILWFFLIVSPIFPLLIFYPPIRNTAKIWVGEFFRWLLYAPLFAIFLSGVVFLWNKGFIEVTRTDVIYPTAINILLGGPGQSVGYIPGEYENNINNPETFFLYVIALLMLWAVIIVPFILLQIFLSYFNNFSFADNPMMQKIINGTTNLVNRATPDSPMIPPPAGSGLAKVLPFANKITTPDVVIPQQEPKTTGLAREIPVQTVYNRPVTVNRPMTMQNMNDITRLLGIQVPTIRDIARIETSTLSRDIQSHQSIAQVREKLERIANPTMTTTLQDRQQYSLIKERLQQAKQQGNPLATAILTATNTAVHTTTNTVKEKQSELMRETLKYIANPQAAPSLVEQQRYTQLRDRLVQESRTGNPLATTVIKTATSLVQNEKTIDKQTVEKLRETLTANQNNTVATTVLSAANTVSTNTSATTTTSTTESQTTNLQQVLTSIAYPEQITSTVEREKYTKIKDMLVKEKEEGNPLATTVLSIVTMLSQQTTQGNTQEVENVVNQMTQQSTNPVSTMILSIANTLSSTVTNTEGKESSTQQTSNVQQALQYLAHPEKVATEKQRDQVKTVKELLVRESEKGNNLASQVLTVVNNLTQQTSNKVINETVENIINQLVKESEKGNMLATAVLAESKVKDIARAAQAPVTGFPAANRVQSVSLEDYEAVKKMWLENYQKIEPPQGQDRKAWVQRDIDKINAVINLLMSPDPKQEKEGMDKVAGILPFLLMGGFSKTEVIAYLRSKLEAAKSILVDLTKKDEEEETMVTVEYKKEEQPKEMHMHAAEEQKLSQDNEKPK